MKLVDQWHDIENDLPRDWEDVRLTLTTEQPRDLPRAAQVLGPINAGKVGSTLVFRTQRAPAPQGAQTALRLFSRLDKERTWCIIEQSRRGYRRDTRAAADALDAGPSRRSVADELGRSARAAAVRLDRSPLRARDRIERRCLDRTALLCAPLNPARSASRLVVHLPLLGAVGLRRLERDGAALLRASRRRRNRRHDPRPPCPLRHGQRRHPGACVARGWQDAVAPRSGNGHAAAAEHRRARVARVDERALLELHVPGRGADERDAGRLADAGAAEPDRRGSPSGRARRSPPSRPSAP